MDVYLSADAVLDPDCTKTKGVVGCFTDLANARLAADAADSQNDDGQNSHVTPALVAGVAVAGQHG